MIPAPRGYVAHFARKKPDGTTALTSKRVIAFDEDGIPCVLSDAERSLVRADSASNAGDYGWTNEGAHPPILALIPAGGWRIEKTTEDGVTWSEPLVGWGATPDGSVVPLDINSDGKVRTPQGQVPLYTKFRIYHPDRTPSAPATTKEAD